MRTFLYAVAVAELKFAILLLYTAVTYCPRVLYCCDHESCVLPSCCATPAARSDIFPVCQFVLPLADLVAVACAETYCLVHVQEAVEVSSCQAAKLMQVALSLRGVYQMLLEGATKREAFEDAAKFMRVGQGLGGLHRGEDRISRVCLC